MKKILLTILMFVLMTGIIGCGSAKEDNTRQVSMKYVSDMISIWSEKEANVTIEGNNIVASYTLTKERAMLKAERTGVLNIIQRMKTGEVVSKDISSCVDNIIIRGIDGQYIIKMKEQVK